MQKGFRMTLCMRAVAEQLPTSDRQIPLPLEDIDVCVSMSSAEGSLAITMNFAAV